MERVAWTDERLDDLARRIDAGFARVDADIRDLRGDVSTLGTGLRGEIAGLRSEMQNEFQAFRLTILRVGGGIMVGLVGIIAAVLVQGA